ncbi:hypothetical protein OF66_2218 [Seleniivibrio woodruffii]|uniref:Uncharacterized protein n=1 Tax=Seleniivibrio woodruffii TaxID=1078050 RepID=A0A4V2PS15_9BACT|nr:hypothetical protein [Seleniivibrio woodruffii]TCK60961.1 hypothetical protein C8D98_1842 [Seleniivibrio woodruffii]TVZ36591.1 hypothetical protein OF66_2218 [Seleniivibrio woodruffii]
MPRARRFLIILSILTAFTAAETIVFTALLSPDSEALAEKQAFTALTDRYLPAVYSEYTHKPLPDEPFAPDTNLSSAVYGR